MGQDGGNQQVPPLPAQLSVRKHPASVPSGALRLPGGRAEKQWPHQPLAVLAGAEGGRRARKRDKR